MGALASKLMFKNSYEKLPFTKSSFYELKAIDLDKNLVSFQDFKGKYKAFLIVNLASKCGLTDNNYKQLVQLDQEYRQQGLKILGFPCNQFLDQEYSCVDDLKLFMKSKNVEFQVFDLVKVNGPQTHEVYLYLRQKLLQKKEKGLKMIPWNFSKFLVDSNGEPQKFFGPKEEFQHIIIEINKMLE